MTTIIPETPMPASDRLVSAIDEYTKQIESDLKSARAENAQLNRQLDSTTNEATLLREQLAAKTKAFDAVQAYATGLDTKLQVIVDVVGGIKADAMRYGARKFSPNDADEESTVEGSTDIAAILSRLPRNELSHN